MQGKNSLLLIHIELIHWPSVFQIPEHRGQCFTSKVGDFHPQLPGWFCPQTDSVIRHASAGDVFPSTPCTVQEVHCDHQTILEQFLVVVGSDNWNRVGNSSTQSGLNFFQQQI